MRFPTRNVNADINEQAMRHAPPVPPNRFVEPPPGQLMGAAYIEREMERRRQEQRAQQAQAAPTIAGDAVSCLAILLQAVADQQADQPISPQATQALGDFSRILEVARARGVGAGSGFAVAPV